MLWWHKGSKVRSIVLSFLIRSSFITDSPYYRPLVCYCCPTVGLGEGIMLLREENEKIKENEKFTHLFFLHGRNKYQHSLDTGTQKTESACAKFRVWSVVAPKHTLGFISLQSATTLGVIFLHSRRQRIQSHEVWGHQQIVWTSASKYHRRCVPRNHTSTYIAVIEHYVI